MNPGEPTESHPEQELSPFAEKMRALLQEFLDAHQEEFSEEKITEKVSQIISFFDGKEDAFIYKSLQEPNRADDFNTAVEKVITNIDIFFQMKEQFIRTIKEFKNLRQQITDEKTDSGEAEGLRATLREYLTQNIFKSELNIEKVLAWGKIRDLVEKTKEFPDEARNNAGKIMYQLLDLRNSLGSTVVSLASAYYGVKEIIEERLGQKYTADSNIFTDTAFKDKVEKDIQAEIKADGINDEEVNKKIQEAKELQEPWEKQLDPLYEAGVLEYIPKSN